MEITPFNRLLELSNAFVAARCLHVVADLGVADALDDVPQRAADLARASGANPDALDRVLRLLSAYGVFHDDGGLFSHTTASRMLRQDHPQSMRAFVRMVGMPLFRASYDELEHSVMTGLPAVDKVMPEGMWAHLANNPNVARVFNEAMTSKAHGQIKSVVSAYAFADFRLIGDIGGGRGHLLQAVLSAAPNAKGVLFDLPHAIANASSVASERLALHAGDFFKDTLPVCDAYLFMDVIHNWNDDDAVAILSAVRRAALPHAKVLLIGAIFPDEPGPHWCKTLDIHMLALLAGRQRTRAQYAQLVAAAGMRIDRQIDTDTSVSILEASLQ